MKSFLPKLMSKICPDTFQIRYKNYKYTMPDYLGADQRKVGKEEDKDDKPIQGII